MWREQRWRHLIEYHSFEDLIYLMKQQPIGRAKIETKIQLIL